LEKRFTYNARLAELDPQPVSNAELIAILLRVGVQGGNATQIKAAIELGVRLRLESPDERPTIHSPADAAALVQYEMAALPQEHLRVINLDTRNKVHNIEKLYIGSLNASTVRVTELFRPAISRNAAEFLLFIRSVLHHSAVINFSSSPAR
jgi:DNA repair protein RadC